MIQSGWALSSIEKYQTWKFFGALRWSAQRSKSSVHSANQQSRSSSSNRTSVQQVRWDEGGGKNSMKEQKEVVGGLKLILNVRTSISR